MIWVTQSWFLLPLCMFVRKKKNRSGTVTIVVVDKSHGRFREVLNLGTSSDAHEIDKLEMEARKWLSKNIGQSTLDLWPEERLLPESEIISSIKNLRQDGAVQLLEQVYSGIGFDSLEDKVLRDLAIARVCEPQSKLATVDYMRRYWGEDYHYQKVYRYMDTLYNNRKEEVLKIYKEFERILKVIEVEMSVNKVLDIAKTLSTITIALPNGETVVKTLFLTNDQKLIEPVYV
ncbi:MAG: hypothetical protein RR254_07570, partial [Muribaculaceae bacterium]